MLPTLDLTGGKGMAGTWGEGRLDEEPKEKGGEGEGEGGMSIVSLFAAQLLRKEEERRRRKMVEAERSGTGGKTEMGERVDERNKGKHEEKGRGVGMSASLSSSTVCMGRNRAALVEGGVGSGGSGGVEGVVREPEERKVRAANGDQVARNKEIGVIVGGADDRSDRGQLTILAGDDIVDAGYDDARRTEALERRSEKGKGEREGGIGGKMAAGRADDEDGDNAEVEVDIPRPVPRSPGGSVLLSVVSFLAQRQEEVEGEEAGPLMRTGEEEGPRCVYLVVLCMCVCVHIHKSAFPPQRTYVACIHTCILTLRRPFRLPCAMPANYSHLESSPFS